MTNNQHENIDQYLTGKLSESELTSFKESIESDPSLKGEVEFQQMIVEGLQSYRKTQLKSRLDRVSVEASLLSNSLLKVAGGVATATIGGLIVYSLYSTEPPVGSSINVDAPIEVEKALYEWELTSIEKEEEEVDPLVTGKIKAPIADANKSEEVVEIPTVKEEKFIPTFTTPDINEVEDEETAKVADLDEIKGSFTVQPEEPIDVETKQSRTSKIKYKYYDGKLFLDGDFESKPYEILEIMGSSGRRVYIKYLGQYYQVELTDKLKELPLVADPDVLNELKMLKETKTSPQ